MKSSSMRTHGIYFALTSTKVTKWTCKATWDLRIKKTNISLRSTFPAVDTTLFVSPGIIASTYNPMSMISSVLCLRPEGDKKAKALVSKFKYATCRIFCGVARCGVAFLDFSVFRDIIVFVAGADVE